MRWVDRKFSFDFPVSLYPNFISRLRGTPLRAAEVGRGVDPDALIWRDGESWSAQENVGHLAVLDQLWQTRLADFLASRDVLTPWDTTNQATCDAAFNSRPWGDVLGEFAAVRADFVRRLEALDEPDFELTALHPRLQTPMRLIDGLYFAAEHDDHHLAIAWQLARKKSG